MITKYQLYIFISSKGYSLKFFILYFYFIPFTLFAQIDKSKNKNRNENKDTVLIMKHHLLKLSNKRHGIKNISDLTFSKKILLLL